MRRFRRLVDAAFCDEPLLQLFMRVVAGLRSRLVTDLGCSFVHRRLDLCTACAKSSIAAAAFIFIPNA